MLCTLVTALIAPAYAYVRIGSPSAFGYLSADAFIYLSVAANSHFGAYTFDGTHLTNGFHPFWQMLLQAVFQVFGIASKTYQIAVSFWLSVALVTAGGILTAQAVLRWTGSFAASLLLFPGLFGIAMLVCGWPVGTMWHFLNGMESPASLLFFGLTLFYLSRFNDLPVARPTGIDRKQLFVLSLLSAGIVFSRLDDVFLPAIIALWLLLQRSQPMARRIEAVLWFGLPLGGAVVAYLVFNHLTVGYAMPISGASKFDFRTPLINIGLLGTSLHALVPDFLYSAGSGETETVWTGSINLRNAQMLLPAIAARVLISHMKWLRLDRDNAFPVWMRLLLIYVMVKGLYNFLFVPLIHQGQWYYPLSITIINIAAAILVMRAWKTVAARRPAFGPLIVPAAAVFTAASLVFFLSGQQSDPAKDPYAAFFQRGPEIAAKLRETVAKPRIVEADDGIVNYALGLPTMSGFLFTIDPDGYAAYKAGSFLTEASRRGYQLIGSLYYLSSVPPDELTPERIPDTLRDKTFNATAWDLDKFDFKLEYRDAATGAVFIRFTPKP